MCKVIAFANQKGGVAKTTSTLNVGIGLAREGKKVLLVDLDPQGNLTIGLGYDDNDAIENTITQLMRAVINSGPLNYGDVILGHEEEVDLIPCNIDLASLDVQLVYAFNREKILSQVIEPLKQYYDYILIDCPPSLGMLTINALTCADKVLLPVSPAYYAYRGLGLLLDTINKVKNQLNPSLAIDGLLITRADFRTSIARDFISIINEQYSSTFRIYNDVIPIETALENSATAGESIFLFNSKSNTAKAYGNVVKEFLAHNE